ncbi:MAG TPA: hypothetical protein VFM93_08085 [Candidatus Limnocylindria bacterium]|nr:hypothetical protein [Candidatus Limnocylindria bacterium]
MRALFALALLIAACGGSATAAPAPAVALEREVVLDVLELI